MSRFPVSVALVRDVPFESESEALTICLDQLTGEDGWPARLQGPIFAAERGKLKAAVQKAVKEDLKGEVSPAAADEVDKAVASLRDKFKKSVPELSPDYPESDDFLRALAGLTRMLDTGKLKPIFKRLETGKDGTLADLVGFMQAYNLRFGPAKSDRQKEIYRTLAPALAGVVGEKVSTVRPNPTALKAVLQQSLKGLSWKDIQTAAESN